MISCALLPPRNYLARILYRSLSFLSRRIHTYGNGNPPHACRISTHNVRTHARAQVRIPAASVFRKAQNTGPGFAASALPVSSAVPSPLASFFTPPTLIPLIDTTEATPPPPQSSISLASSSSLARTTSNLKDVRSPSCRVIRHEIKRFRGLGYSKWARRCFG